MVLNLVSGILIGHPHDVPGYVLATLVASVFGSKGAFVEVTLSSHF